MANSIAGRCADARLVPGNTNSGNTLSAGGHKMTTIDLNCDLGEGHGAWEMGNDAAMIELATSVNIACGFHAGDADIMRKTVELAKARGVSIGAHPGYRDLHGFGRRPVPGLKASEIENLVAYQIGALQAIATAAGHKVTHVKAHGALSNIACEDDMTARAIASAIRAVDPNLIFVVLANSRLVQAGEAANLPMVHEVFADRAYEDDGSLVSRRKPGAVLHDAKQIAQRVVRIVQDGAVVSVTGKVIKMRTDTVCIHGDTPRAISTAPGVSPRMHTVSVRILMTLPVTEITAPSCTIRTTRCAISVASCRTAPG